MKWTKKEIELSLKMIQEGKSFLQIANELGRSQAGVTKKLNRLGYKSGYRPNGTKSKGCKYSKYNWDVIQRYYDDGSTYKGLIKKFNLTPQAIKWAKDNNKLKLRSISEGVKLAWKNNKFKSGDKEGIERYRQLCQFRFNLKDYPDEFNFGLIEEHGWYKAKNKGDNPDGVSRDHMYSISEGFKNNVDPYYISHPANCRLVKQKYNNKKDKKCDITLEKLIERVKEWDEKYE